MRYFLCLLALAFTARAELKTDIEYARPGGVSLTLDAFVPEGEGSFPTCILVHGGGFTKGDKSSFIKPLFKPLSQAGFTWFTINYRLAPTNRFPACIEDAQAAIRWVRAHAKEYKADDKRIAIIGESAGGHIVSLVGVRAKGETAVAAVVPFYAPHDLEFQVNARHALGPSMEALFGLTELNDFAWKVLRDASSTSYLRQNLPPYLLIHGDKDALVPYEQSVQFQQKMKALGARCDFITIKGGGHGMGGWDKLGSDYKEQMIAWLKTTLAAASAAGAAADQHIGLGARPAPGAEVVLDGTRESLDAKWIYWEGPGFKAAMPIQWQIVPDPVDGGTCVSTDDRAAAGGKYGAADIVTKKAYRDFRLHIEFLVMKPGGNSGVYLQNRYEIQVLDGDKTPHGMGAVINQTESPYHAYHGVGQWNAYDMVFRAARFQDGKLTEKAMVSMYFNGQKVHRNVRINQVWGGPNSGIDGGHDGGKGITDTPQGLKLQAEGHDVRYRNAWIKELDLKEADTDF